MTRTHRTTSVFTRPFRLRGVDRVLPAGSYDVVTEEERIEGLSFPVYRRVSTVIFVPGQIASSTEMMTIDPLDLAAAQGEDANPQHMKEAAMPSVPHLVRHEERFRFERLDVGVDFDGAPIEKRWFITPLAYGIERGLIKHRIPFESLQGANCAIGVDESVKFDAPFAGGLPG